jgi:hypothetical protein
MDSDWSTLSFLEELSPVTLDFLGTHPQRFPKLLSKACI